MRLAAYTEFSGHGEPELFWRGVMVAMFGTDLPGSGRFQMRGLYPLGKPRKERMGTPNGQTLLAEYRRVEHGRYAFLGLHRQPVDFRPNERGGFVERSTSKNIARVEGVFQTSCQANLRYSDTAKDIEVAQ